MDLSPNTSAGLSAQQEGPQPETPDAVLRLFVAIELTDGLRDAMRSAQERLQVPGAKVSWTTPEAMHLTLVFLGDTFAVRIPVWRQVLDEVAAASDPFKVTFGRLGTFGRARAPRVIWVGVLDPPKALILLQQRIAEALREKGARFETRPFHAHVTLGRVRSARHAIDWQKAIDAGLPCHPLGAQDVGHVALMQSMLTPTGPRYRRLHASLLGGH